MEMHAVDECSKNLSESCDLREKEKLSATLAGRYASFLTSSVAFRWV
jgi:hypothetical protein